MTKKRKTFDEDFKKMILDLNQSGHSIDSLAEEYGIAT
ncbi:transposase, partial [Lactobacillus sp. CC-MHH1034]|nr:transposase [Agrilactobacillus fermenti]